MIKLAFPAKLPVRRVARDLSILLAWASAVTWIMLNIFYTRTCQGPLPCQNLSDLTLFFVVAFGAGAVMEDERIVVVGFVLVHLLSTIFFLTSLTAPTLLGLTEASLSDAIVNLSVVIAFRSQFPLAFIVSFIGCSVGFFFRGKLGIS